MLAAIAKKCGPVGPLDAFPIDEPEVSLVHQRGGLKYVASAFARHVMQSQPMQFSLHLRRKSVKCLLVSLTPGDQ
jgi:hypothetical protein